MMPEGIMNVFGKVSILLVATAVIATATIVLFFLFAATVVVTVAIIVTAAAIAEDLLLITWDDVNIDAHVNAPTSFDDLIGTWDMLDHELNAIESATLQRDQALHPDDPPKPARQVIDIPR